MTTSPQARERALKKFSAGFHKALVLCSAPWRGCVEQQLRTLLPAEYAEQQRNDGPIELERLSYRQLIHVTFSLTGSREILWILKEKRVGSMSELRSVIERIPWHCVFEPETAVALRLTLHRSRLRHEGACRELTVRTLAGCGVPVVDERATHLLDLRIEANQLVLAISFSGPDMHRRRYKDALHSSASLREDTAANVLQWSRNEFSARSFGTPQSALVPFAGSGTLGFEAVMLWNSIAPCLFNRTFALEHFPCTPQATLRYLRTQAAAAVIAPDDGMSAVTMTELDPEQFRSLRVNVNSFTSALSGRQLPLPAIRAVEGDVLAKPWGTNVQGSCLVILNPPWGERLGKPNETLRLYQQIGDRLRRFGTSHSAAVGFVALGPNAAAIQSLLQSAGPAWSTRRAGRSGGKSIQIVCGGFAAS